MAEVHVFGVVRATGGAPPEARTIAHRDIAAIVTDAEHRPIAASKLLRAAGPLVRQLLPLGLDLVPTAQYLGAQKDQVVASIANIASVLNATEPQPDGTSIPYLRAITFFSPEGFVGVPKRQPWNRRNPYLR